MQTIVSRTTIERVIRTTLVWVLVILFAIYYLYDGYVGYARQNARELARLLGVPGESLAAPNPALTAEEGRRVAEIAKPGDPLDKTTGTLGAPSLRQAADVYYLGPGGWLHLNLQNDRIVSATWTNANHTDADQRWQRRIGYVLSFAGICLTLQLLRVLTTRVTLSDEGLGIGRTPPIPFAAMKSLRRHPSGKIGLFELEYLRDGTPRRLRLDDYVITELPRIVENICQRQNWSDPSGKA